MTDPKYPFSGRVRFSEVDEDGILTLYHLINYLQDCSSFHAEDRGVGIDDSRKKGYGWVLINWKIHIARYPRLGETITVKTWPYRFRSCLGQRNFSIEDENGKDLVHADSDWVMVDLKTRKAANIGEDQISAYGIYPELQLKDDFGGRKVHLLPGGVEKPSFTIEEHHLDTNHHVNNAEYFRMAQRFLPIGFRAGRIRAEYRLETLLGESLTPEVLQTEHGYQVTLKGADGKPHFVSEWDERPAGLL